MKIGILTFSAALNFGAQLQAFALRMYLVSQGHDVQVLNYAPSFLTKPYSLFRRLSIKRSFPSFIKQFVITILELIPLLKRKKKMCSFQKKNFNFTCKICSCADIPNDFGCIIVGSDQVWNKELTAGVLDDVFFLKDYIGNKNSYAASFSTKHCTREDLVQMSMLIDSFQQISVRETSSKKTLQQYTRKEIYECIDPTFLLSKNEWNAFIPSKKNNDRYILVYQARGQHFISDNVVSQLKKQLGVKKVINLTGNENSLWPKDKLDVSPLEFVKLINDAECVVSISFHGVALSLIMETPFYYISLDDGRNGRVEDLLNIYDLSNRIVKKSDSINFSPIDFRLHKQNGFEYCRRSKEYIQRITRNERNS